MNFSGLTVLWKRNAAVVTEENKGGFSNDPCFEFSFTWRKIFSSVMPIRSCYIYKSNLSKTQRAAALVKLVYNFISLHTQWCLQRSTIKVTWVI